MFEFVKSGENEWKCFSTKFQGYDICTLVMDSSVYLTKSGEIFKKFTIDNKEYFVSGDSMEDMRRKAVAQFLLEI